MNRILKQSIQTSVSILLGVALSLSSRPGSAALPVSKDHPVSIPASPREALVEEPVFHGQAYIYEAGLQHDLSVVLVHGVGDNGARDWEYLIPALARHYHVVAFDLPGFGRSSKQNELYSPARYAEFVKWVVGRYVKGPFVLIGHSFGGAVALRYAAGSPAALQRLILVDVAGILHRVAYTKQMARLNPPAWQSKLPGNPVDTINDIVRTMLDTMDRESVTKNLDEVIDNPSLRKTVLGSDPKRIAALALMLEDFSQAIDQVRTPTLVIWGEHDTVAPLRTGKVLAGRLPAARLEIIPQAGHLPMLEQAEQFNRVVLREIAAPPVGQPNSSPAKQPSATDRVGRCDNEDGVTFTGGYRLMVISNCKHVQIEDATIRLLDVSDSEVVIENSRITGNDVSLKTDESELTLTNVTVEGDVAIQTSRSRLDLAGVKLAGKTAAVFAKKDSTLIFSVSRVESPYTSGYLHGSRKVTAEHPL